MDSITKPDDEIPTFAPSLQEPSVKETVIKDPLGVPERYIRSEEDMQKKKTIHVSAFIRSSGY